MYCILRLSLLTAAMLLSRPAPATATVLDFNDVGFVDEDTATLGTVYVEDGFILRTSGVQDNGQFRNNGFAAINPVSQVFTGSPALFDNTPGSTISLQRFHGGPFALRSIEIAALNGIEDGDVTFVGFKTDGATVMQIVGFRWNFDPYEPRITHFGPGFDSVVKVTWQQVDPYHQFDNIIVEVPETSLMLLLGSALFARGVRRRRS